ncbi:LacI family DNA-binding transcriptional regulator [Pseudaestuariivita rosea]|uniref:LacI family DNA-binding transcriptional regulator n=1 Tax=Pseudaestuariivita rosea TaxID=2763263 RepID=UPI001ABA6072|nr:LacI family DNA-binding transcriptional regulator [Pseudaestuariivita rosea]
MNKRATIEDVARIAGVSTATVSRTIHTPDIVSDSTRQAVFGAIDQTGFTLNQAARNLRQRRANAVIVLVPDIGNTFFSEILAGIERVASAANQTILIGDAGQDPRRAEKFLNALINGQADGALLLNGHLPPSLVERFGPSGATLPPIVSVSEGLEQQVVPHVGIDNAAAACMAVQYLIDHGHRRIAHLRGPADNILTRQRHQGFLDGMKDAGLTVAPDHIFDGDFTIESGIAAARSLVNQTNSPTVIFCSNDEMAIGLMSECAVLGLRVPQDVSVIGFDDIAFSKVASPRLTTIRQPRLDIGEAAMKLLLGLIAADAVPDAAMETHDVQLIERDSVRFLR